MQIFKWLDEKSNTKEGKLINQLIPVVVCLILLGLFMWATHFFALRLINPFSKEKIQIEFHVFDILVGFFLYFVAAIDYALIVGRMQITNPGSKARLIMNIFTCIGCFAGVSIVLFLWGFAKELPWLIIPILIFAGSVMIRLAYDGREYFEHNSSINKYIATFTLKLLEILYYPTRVLTFWMPELASPKVERLSLNKLALWSFFLPFIIGLDDLIGYMGAMTIYNAFSLIFGIYIADIVIDIMIFVSPKFTAKIVQNPLLSLLAAYAFLYLAYKSFTEAGLMLQHKYHLSTQTIVIDIIIFVMFVASADTTRYLWNLNKTKKI